MPKSKDKKIAEKSSAKKETKVIVPTKKTVSLVCPNCGNQEVEEVSVDMVSLNCPACGALISIPE